MRNRVVPNRGPARISGTVLGTVIASLGLSNHAPTWAAAPAPLIQRHNSRITGYATFLTALEGGTLHTAPDHRNAEFVARAFLEVGGHLFGVTDQSKQLVRRQSWTDALGGRHCRFGQVHRGVAVFTGELVVHDDGAGRVVAANGDFYPIPPTLSPTPSLDSHAATQRAKRAMNCEACDIRKASLVIVDPGWYGELPLGPRLAYHVILEDLNVPLVESLFLDAQTGAVLDRWSELHTVLNRFVHDAMGTTAMPGTSVRTEGEAPVTEVDANRAYDYSGDVFEFYSRAFGRDSFDDAGAPLRLTVNSTFLGCPNAFWLIDQSGYCAGTLADDIVGHELTHGLILQTAGLVFRNQSGQINESFADVFGEMLDLFNGGAERAGVLADAGPWPAHPTGPGLDAPNSLRTSTCSSTAGHPDGVRWLFGEDSTAFGGPIRDLWRPSCHGHPDRAGSPLQTCRSTDFGGVHSGSGILNHAFAIATDGKTFNGQTVMGIGPVKSLAVWYRALTTYLTPASDFEDAYLALTQAAVDLIGTDPLDPKSGAPSGSSFTYFDAEQVDRALLAVELNTDGACGATRSGPINDLCPDASCLTEGITRTASTVGATGDQTSSCSFEDDRDVWYSYTPERSEPVVVSLCGSLFDTTLEVFDACGGTDLACNDDGCPSGTELGSMVTFDGLAGVTYWIRVAGFEGLTGVYTVSVLGGGGNCVGCPAASRPAEPVPADGAVLDTTDVELGWSAIPGPSSDPSCPTTYEVLIGESGSGLTTQCAQLMNASCSTVGLICNRDYEWRVIAQNCCGLVESPVWRFRTGGCPCGADVDCDDGDPCTTERCDLNRCAFDQVICPVGQTCDSTLGCRDDQVICLSNQITDPGFEDGGEAWRKLNQPGRAVVTGIARTGSHALELTVSPQVNRDVYEQFSVSEGTTYSVSAWVQTENITAGSTMVTLRWRDSSNAGFASDEFVVGAGSSSWVRINGSAVAPPGATSVRVVLFTGPDPSDLNGRVWFDDVQVCTTPRCCEFPINECAPCPCPAVASDPVVLIGTDQGPPLALFDGFGGSMLTAYVPVGAAGAGGSTALAANSWTTEIYVAEANGGGIAAYAVDPATCLVQRLRTVAQGMSAHDMVLGPDGMLYVPEDGTNRVTRLDPLTGVIDSGFNLNGCNLDDPGGLAFLNNGRLLVSNRGRKNLVSVDVTTGLCEEFASGCGLSRPGALLVMPNGQVLVADEFTDSVVKFDRCGACVNTLIPTGSCGLDEPTALALGPTGHLLVASHGSGEVVQFDPADGSPVDRDALTPGVQCAIIPDTSLGRPVGLAVTGSIRDCNGNGVPDDTDLTLGGSTDCDGSGVPDECKAPSSVVMTSPTSQVIDARQPSTVTGGPAMGWSTIRFTFSCNADCVDAADFRVVPATGPPLHIVGFTRLNDDIELTLDRPIPPGSWTTVVFEPNLTTLCLGYLPADANRDGASNSLDILSLIDHFNGVRFLPDYSADIDRSGAITVLDINRLVDLLNGAGALDPWLGRRLPPTPCRPCLDDGDCDDDLFCNGLEHCVAGSCQPGVPIECADLTTCTVDQCDESNDQCVHVPNDASCDNDLYCDGPERCVPGSGCLSGPPPCLVDVCDESADACRDCLLDTHCPIGSEPCSRPWCTPDFQCSQTPLPDGISCDDDDPCTDNDHCLGGVCAGDPHCPTLVNPCLTASCALDGTCLESAVPDDTACDDADPCTNNDRCLGGVCAGDPVLLAPGEICVP